MYCANCSRDLPDDANYCMTCGGTLFTSEKLEVAEPEPGYEACQVFLLRYNQPPLGQCFCFRAINVSPTGVNVIKDSKQVFPITTKGKLNNDEDTEKTYDDFLQALAEEGWKYESPGADWYNAR